MELFSAMSSHPSRSKNGCDAMNSLIPNGHPTSTTTRNSFMAKTFEELLFDGAIIALRTLTLDELYQQVEVLEEMGLPDDLMAFPTVVLAKVIREKQNARAMN